MTILEMLTAEVDVLLVSAAVESLDNIEMHCWMRKREIM